MAERKYTHGLKINREKGTFVISIGDMEIWDGADLSLVRDTLVTLIRQKGRRCVGIDMQFVQYVPSGFFGMLFDWHDAGIEVRLVRPRERVRNMLWFRKFFDLVDSGIYRLHEGSGVSEETSEELWPAAPSVDRDKVLSSLVG